jgi:hypothetical protein
MVKSLYERQGRSAVAPEIAVKAWGYSGLSGNARSKLGAVKSYGLIGSAKEGVAISERALDLLLLPPSKAEYVDALQAAALEPAIFEELYRERRGNDDDALNHYLVKQRKFTDEGAKTVIEVYRNTLAFAGLGASDYTDAEPERNSTVTAAPVRASAFAPAATVRTEHRWTLGKDVDAQLTISGVMRPEHVKRLQRYVDLLTDALEDDPPAPKPEDDEAPE